MLRGNQGRFFDTKFLNPEAAIVKHVMTRKSLPGEACRHFFSTAPSQRLGPNTAKVNPEPRVSPLTGLTKTPASGSCQKPGRWSVQFDLNIHTGGKIELHQRIDRLVGGVYDIHQAFVRSDLVLVARILVHMR